jgi:hypothetical protein
MIIPNNIRKKQNVPNHQPDIIFPKISRYLIAINWNAELLDTPRSQIAGKHIGGLNHHHLSFA